MAGAYTIDSEDGDPMMPHTVFTSEELDTQYPPVSVPEAVDADDPYSGIEDATLTSGLKTASQLVKACNEQGRKKRLD